MMGRGILAFSPSRRGGSSNKNAKNAQSSSSPVPSTANRSHNNREVIDWTGPPWMTDDSSCGNHHGGGEEREGDLSLEDMVPPAPPTGTDGNSDSSSIENQSCVSRKSVRSSTALSTTKSLGLHHGNTPRSAVVVAQESPKNDHPSNTNSNNNGKPPQSPHVDENNYPVSLSFAQERAKRLEAMEARLEERLQREPSQTLNTATPTPTTTNAGGKKKRNKLFGRTPSPPPLSYEDEHNRSSANIIAAEPKKKKKGLLKFFGGGGGSNHHKHKKQQQQQQHSSKRQSAMEQQVPTTSRGDGNSMAATLELESQATLTLGDLVPSINKDLFSLQPSQFKETPNHKDATAKEETASNKKETGDESVSTADNNFKKKPKPLITTAISESNAADFASSLLDLQQPHSKDRNNDFAKMSGTGNHNDDDDNTTISNLTNPTFQSAAWALTQQKTKDEEEIADDEAPMPTTTPTVVHKNTTTSSNSSSSNMEKQQPQPPANEEQPHEGQTSSPIMGDFFVDKTSTDSWEKTGVASWEKADDFSDPFFGKMEEVVKSNNDGNETPASLSVFVQNSNKIVDEGVEAENGFVVKQPSRWPSPIPVTTAITAPSVASHSPVIAAAIDQSPSSAATQRQMSSASPVAIGRRLRARRSLTINTQTSPAHAESSKKKEQSIEDWSSKVTQAGMELREKKSKQQQKGLEKSGKDLADPKVKFVHPTAARSVVAASNDKSTANSLVTKDASNRTPSTSTSWRASLYNVPSSPLRQDRKKMAVRYLKRNGASSTAVRTASPTDATSSASNTSIPVSSVAAAYLAATSPKSQSTSSTGEKSDKSHIETAKMASPWKQPNLPSVANTDQVEGLDKASTVAPPPIERTNRRTHRYHKMVRHRSFQTRESQCQPVSSCDSGSISAVTATTCSKAKPSLPSAVCSHKSPEFPPVQIETPLQTENVNKQQIDHRVSFSTREISRLGLKELGHILNRPRARNRGRTPKVTGPMESVFFKCYDESKVKDPMARAGLRLLSSAVVPIQATVRRFLVCRLMLTHQWASLVVQTRYRGYLQRVKFQREQHAAVQIQRMTRGMLVWERLCLEDYCATEIQRIFRGHFTFEKSVNMLSKVILLQSAYRKRLAQQMAAKKMEALLYIQSCVRGCMVRQSIAYEHFCAIEIQRQVRGYLATLEVYEQIYKVTTVQSCVRQKQAAARVQQMRLARREAMAVTVQRYVRGFLAAMLVYEAIFNVIILQNLVRRRQAKKLAVARMQALIRIQAQCRRYKIQSTMDRHRTAAIDIQRVTRGYLAMMDVFEDIYRITLVQNCYRMKKAKEVAQCRRRLFVQVQRLARGFLVQRTYKLKREGAITIQSNWRAFYHRLLFQFKLLDIIMVQSLWRRKLATRSVQKKRNDIQNAIRVSAATTIQSQWRSYDATMLYLHYLASVLAVQCIIRRWLAKLTVAKYVEGHSLKLQRVGRGFLVRSKKRKNEAAVSIQSTWRGFVSYADYMFTIAHIVLVQAMARRWFALKEATQIRDTKAASRIQQYWRTACDKAAFQTALHKHISARDIQSAWRMFVVSADYRISVSNSVLIQSAFRMFLERQTYKQYLRNIAILQSAFRAFCAKCRVTGRRCIAYHYGVACGVSEQHSYAAIRIQCRFRCFRAGKAYMRFLSVRLLQAVYRGYVERLTLKRHRAAMKIQASWRGFLQFTDYLFVVCDIIRVQSLARCFLERQRYLQMKFGVQNASAIAIQRSWRRFSASVNFLLDRADTILVQAYVRGIFARKKYQELAEAVFQEKALAAGKIQSIWRMYKARETLLFRIAEYVAASIIQADWRRCSARRCYIRTVRKVVRIQSIGRMLLSKCQVYVFRERKAAIAVQTFWRCYLQYVKYTLKKMDIVVVQSCARRWIAGRNVQRLRHEKRTSRAIQVQKIWRGFQCYTDYLMALSDVITVQGCARQLLAKRKCYALRNKRDQSCAVVLQNQWRMYFCRNNFVEVLQHVVIVQTIARSFFARKQFQLLQQEREESSAILLQNVWRGFSCYVKYALILSDILQVQAYTRSRFARQELNRRKGDRDCKAAINIQKTWRFYFCRSNYELMIHDATLVQCQVRRYLARKEMLKMFATTIQSAWRGYYAFTNYILVCADLVKVQSFVRAGLARSAYKALLTEKRNKEHAAMQMAAANIQKVCRGHLVYTTYLIVLSDIIQVQSMARSLFAKRLCSKLQTERNCHAACTIQKAWRGYLVFTTYIVVYSDIVKAQSVVRRYFAKKLHNRLCMKRDYGEVIKIQKTWRGYVQCTSYALMLTDIIKAQCAGRSYLAKQVFAMKLLLRHQETVAMTIQRYWRGYLGRLEVFYAWKQHVREVNKAAVQLQKIWRRFSHQQRYLYTIGSAIQIQSLGRMFLVQAENKRRFRAARAIQTVRRSFVARMRMLHLLGQIVLQSAKHNKDVEVAKKIQKAWRKKKLNELMNARARIIQSFMLQASCKIRSQRRVTQHEAAYTLQLWYRVAKQVRETKKKRAARVIYKFLKMVKEEVDRAIRAEKKRLKMRERLRQRTKEFDEELLETAWLKIDLKQEAEDTGRKQRSKKSTKASSGSGRSSSRRDRPSPDQMVQHYSATTPTKDPPPLPRLRRRPNDECILEPDFILNDARMPSPMGCRIPKPRMKAFNPQQIDEDFSLEEAYLDAEIFGAKKRRQALKHQQRKNLPRRSPSNSTTKSSSSVPMSREDGHGRRRASPVPVRGSRSMTPTPPMYG